MAERASAMVSRPPRAMVRGSAILFSFLDPARKRRTVPGGQEHERDDKPSMAPLPRIHRDNCVAISKTKFGEISDSTVFLKTRLKKWQLELPPVPPLQVFATCSTCA